MMGATFDQKFLNIGFLKIKNIKKKKVLEFGRICLINERIFRDQKFNLKKS